MKGICVIGRLLRGAARFAVASCLLLLTSCLFLSGCGYTLQTRANLPFEDIAVGRIENKTHEPKVQDRFHRALSETLALYGFRINHNARHVLEGEILDFRLVPLVEQSLVATQYQVIIRTALRLRDKETGRTTPISTDTPYLTYFSSTGKLESVLAAKDSAAIAALNNLAQSLASTIAYSLPSQYAYLDFTVNDLKDAESLVMKLKQPLEPHSRYVREMLTPDMRKLIDDFDGKGKIPDPTKNALTAELNLMLQGQPLYDEKRFARVDLSESVRETARLKTKSLEERVLLNRRLLEEAYPDELVSITYSHLLFVPGDFKDAGALALTLQEPHDALSLFLRENLSDAARRIVDRYSKGTQASDAMKNALAGDLNTLLLGPSLYEPRRFFNLALPVRARELMARKLNAADRVLLNRILLEESYPAEIAVHKPKPVPGGLEKQ